VADPKTKASSRHRRQSPGQYGFTLAELAVVTLLLALFASLMMPSLMRFGDGDLQRSARYLAGTVKYLYNEAALSGLEHRLIFSLDKGSYSAKVLGTDGRLQEIGGSARQRHLPQGTHIRDIHLASRGSFTSGQVTVTFQPGGWVDETVIHLAAAEGENLTLHFDPLTGTVETFNGYKEL